MNKYSVLMSVYHKEKPEWLRQTMNSMWEQTVSTDDFVLVCDGSLTAELDAVIAEMRSVHPELQVVRLERNEGLGNALNVGLKHCKNELVARMDSDDLSLPDRCEKELVMFDANPKLSICSGILQEFWEDRIMGKRVLPETNEEILSFSRKRNPFSHPTVMFRKSAVEKAGSYRETYHLFEDYDLWIRMFQNGCEGYNLQDVVLKMRTPPDAYLRRGGWKYAKEMLRLHRWILKSGWSTRKDFLTGAVPHAVVCIVPNRLRKHIYQLLRG